MQKQIERSFFFKNKIGLAQGPELGSIISSSNILSTISFCFTESSRSKFNGTSIACVNGSTLSEDWLTISEISWIEFTACITLLTISPEPIVCPLKSMTRSSEMFTMGIEYDDWFVLRI